MDILSIVQTRILTSLTGGNMFNGCIRMDPKTGTILEVGPDVQPHDQDVVVPMPGCIVMPGWVVGHTHLYSALARGMPAPRRTPANFVQTLEYLWWVLDRALDSDGVFASGMAGLLQAARAGVTGLVDHHASPDCIDGSLDQLKNAFDEVRMRGLLCYEVTDRNGPEEGSAGIAENVRFARENSTHGLVRGCMGGHASFTIQDNTFDAMAKACLDLDLPLHIHLLEDAADRSESVRLFGKSPVRRLLERGLGREKDLFVHGVHLTDEELDQMSTRDVTMIHNPRSNMNNRVGRARLSSGRWQLGTDGIDNNIVSELCACFYRGREDDPPMPFMQPLEMMRESQKTLGQAFDVVLDELKPGAGADLTILRYDPPTPLSADNLAGHLYFGLGVWAVAATVVRGRFVLRDGQILTCDEPAALASTRAAARRLYRRMEALS